MCHLFVKQWLYHLHFDKYSETGCIGTALFLILCAQKRNVVQNFCVCVCVCVYFAMLLYATWLIISVYRTACTEVQN